MDNLGSEIGHKMRVSFEIKFELIFFFRKCGKNIFFLCLEFILLISSKLICILFFFQSAVKAKLIELGSGTSTGYIDDELPDYVMIMVANKRSKEQMVEDLSLFLNKNTEAFVNWLHQVLDKLQEVTLPATGKFDNYNLVYLYK